MKHNVFRTLGSFMKVSAISWGGVRDSRKLLLGLLLLCLLLSTEPVTVEAVSFTQLPDNGSLIYARSDGGSMYFLSSRGNYYKFNYVSFVHIKSLGTLPGYGSRYWRYNNKEDIMYHLDRDSKTTLKLTTIDFKDNNPVIKAQSIPFTLVYDGFNAPNGIRDYLVSNGRLYLGYVSDYMQYDDDSYTYNSLCSIDLSTNLIKVLATGPYSHRDNIEISYFDYTKFVMNLAYNYYSDNHQPRGWVTVDTEKDTAVYNEFTKPSLKGYVNHKVSTNPKDPASYDVSGRMIDRPELNAWGIGYNFGSFNIISHFNLDSYFQEPSGDRVVVFRDKFGGVFYGRDSTIYYYGPSGSRMTDTEEFTPFLLASLAELDVEGITDAKKAAEQALAKATEASTMAEQSWQASVQNGSKIDALDSKLDSLSAKVNNISFDTTDLETSINNQFSNQQQSINNITRQVNNAVAIYGIEALNRIRSSIDKEVRLMVDYDTRFDLVVENLPSGANIVENNNGYIRIDISGITEPLPEFIRIKAILEEDEETYETTRTLPRSKFWFSPVNIE